MKCEICGKNILRIYKHQIWCKLKNDFLEYYSLDQSQVQKEYNRLGSVQEFIKQYPKILTNNDQYYKLFKFLEIDYSLSKSASSKITRNKTKDTCRKKYGYEHNFQKDSASRKKWQDKLLKEEGITNVFQRESVKEKSLDTIIRKYGSNSNRAKITQRGTSYSSLNEWLYKTLNSLNIIYTPEFPIKKKGGIYYYDCLINDNKLIEVNGDYWHGNPKIYKPDDIILKGSKTGEVVVKNKWASDNRKIKFAENLGYEVLVLWELDIKLFELEIEEKIKYYAKN